MIMSWSCVAPNDDELGGVLHSMMMCWVECCLWNSDRMQEVAKM